MPFGHCEVPKPGCDGAMTRPPLASSVSTGAAGSTPIPGCRNRIGRPEPSSTVSMVVPLTTIDLIASGMREPLYDFLPRFPLHERRRCFKIMPERAFNGKEQLHDHGRKIRRIRNAAGPDLCDA